MAAVCRHHRLRPMTVALERLAEHARGYAALGWAMVPIKKGTKRPPWADWPRRATTDAQVIIDWLEGHPGDNIGILTGERSGIWVLDIDPRNGGDEALADLEAQHGQIDAGVEVLTGGGGRHLYFRYPADRRVHSGPLALGLDVKADGGQVLAPPSVHPDTGRPYTFEVSSTEVGDAPAWLLDLVCDDSRHREPTETIPREELAQSPLAWDRFNAQATNETTAALMQEAGWKIISRARNGVIHLQRPDLYEGEGKEGTSATIGAVTGAPGVLYVWTSSMVDEGWEPEHTYDPAVVLSRVRFGGDDALADEWLASQGFGRRSRFADPETIMERWLAHAAVEAALMRQGSDADDPWADVDIEAVLTSEPLRPALWARSDGLKLLYPASVHWVSGEPAAGKTWMALSMVAQALQSGCHVTYYDFENGPLPLLERAEALGIPRRRLTRQFHVKHPTVSWVGHEERLIREVVSTGTRLVVIDSCASAMSAAGLDPIDNADFGTFFIFVRALAATGAAVVVLDHLRKDDAPTARYPLGAGQKLAQATVAYGLARTAPFAPGRDGQATVYVHKDRHGQVLQAATRLGEADVIGKFILDASADDDLIHALLPYDEGRHRVASTPHRTPPWDVMQGVSDLLVDMGRPLRKTLIAAYVKAPAVDVDIAIDQLVQRGYIAEDEDSRALAYVLVKPYRAEWDPYSPFWAGASGVSTNGSEDQ
ncbi:MAG: hypothetical protein D6683_02445 [Actinomyces sp.]|nr:MAG: hypothetical protein D6683_02445 [Actinomyces sp.]